MKLSIFLLLSIVLASSSYADSFEPTPHCYRPTEPLWLATVYYRNRYTAEVEEYQRCMKAFIVQQEHAVLIHTQAAQKALQTWNEFAQKK